MKVGFCGTQCSGKSTQAGLLVTKGYQLVPSASHIIAESGVPVNRSGTLSTQFMIAGMMEQQSHQNNGTGGELCGVVWERTHVDSIAYAQTCDLWGRHNEYMACLWKLAENMMLNYFDIVFYFPGYDIDLFQGEKENGIRDTNPEYRALIDRYIHTALDSIGVKYCTVPQGDIIEVNDFIMKSISNETMSRNCAEHDIILKRLARS